MFTKFIKSVTAALSLTVVLATPLASTAEAAPPRVVFPEGELIHYDDDLIVKKTHPNKAEDMKLLFAKRIAVFYGAKYPVEIEMPLDAKSGKWESAPTVYGYEWSPLAIRAMRTTLIPGIGHVMAAHANHQTRSIIHANFQHDIPKLDESQWPVHNMLACRVRNDNDDGEVEMIAHFNHLSVPGNPKVKNVTLPKGEFSAVFYFQQPLGYSKYGVTFGFTTESGKKNLLIEGCMYYGLKNEPSAGTDD